MENDVLKNKIAPWQEKGRWYHGVWNLATNAFDSENTDDELLSNDYGLEFTGYTAYMHPKIGTNKSILYVVLKPTSAMATPSTRIINIGNRRFYATGEIGLAIAPSISSSSGLFDVWLFIVKE